jgi:hypothetical protein
MYIAGYFNVGAHEDGVDGIDYYCTISIHAVDDGFYATKKREICCFMFLNLLLSKYSAYLIFFVVGSFFAHLNY